MTISPALHSLSWTTNDGVGQRKLSGTEKFWNFAQASMGGAFDMVSLFELEESSPLADAGVDAWQRGWVTLRRAEPIVACRVDVEGERIVHHSPIAPDGQAVTVQQAASTAAEMVDRCLEGGSFDRFQLFLFTERSSEQGGKIQWAAITNGHALADAMAVSKLFVNLLLLVSGDISGDRVEEEGQLPPCLAVALRQEPNASRIMEMAEVARKPTTTGLAVLPKPDSDTPSKPTPWRRLHAFSPTESTAILTRCKSNGATLSSFIQAAIYHSILSLPGRNIGDDTHTFTVPAMLFSRMSSLPVEEQGAFMATSFAPTSIDVFEGESVCEVAKKVKNSFNRALEMDTAAQEAYVGAMIGMVKGAQTPKIAIPTLSSLGQLDGPSSSPEEGAWEAVKSYQIASRNNQPSLGVHAWSLHGRLNISLAWCPTRFDEAEIDAFWLRLVDIVSGEL